MKNQQEKMAMTARTYMTIGPLVVLAVMGGLTEELLKEFVDEFHIFYTLRLAKSLNSIESVSGNVTIDNIKESKRELVAMFQSYGYNI